VKLNPKEGFRAGLGVLHNTFVFQENSMAPDAQETRQENVEELRREVELLELKARKKKALQELNPERYQQKAVRRAARAEPRRQARRVQRRSEG
jgi:hypothetical protein